MLMRRTLASSLGILSLYSFPIFVTSAPRAAQSAAQQSATAASPAASGFHEELIADIPAGSELKQWTASRNHVAWEEKNGKVCIVKLDGRQQGASYDGVQFMSLSPDGAHLHFFGKRDNKWVHVLDGKEASPPYTGPTSIAFQPDTTSFAYGACSNKKKCYIFVNDKETTPDYEDTSFPRYSADGKHLAFFARRRKKWIAVVDGKETGPELDGFSFSSWGFSPSGRFYAAVLPPHSKWTYIVGDSTGPAFDVISPIVFSDDDNHYAYGGADSHAGFKKQKTLGTIILDGQPRASREGSGMSGLWTVALGATQNITFGVRDLDANFHGVSTPDFAPDGKLVYVARNGKGDLALIHGDSEGPGFDEILSLTAFTKDSGRSFYVARRGTDFVEVRDNQPGKTFPIDAKIGAVDWLWLSADGSHLAYQLVRGGAMYKNGAHSFSYTEIWNGGAPVAPWLRARRTVIIDGQPEKEYNALDIGEPLFTKDLRHHGYSVIGAQGKLSLVAVDANESKLYDDVGYLEMFQDAGKATFIARDSSRLLRVTYPLQ